jgi:uncharacterized membrane protein
MWAGFWLCWWAGFGLVAIWVVVVCGLGVDVGAVWSVVGRSYVPVVRGAGTMPSGAGAAREEQETR